MSFDLSEADRRIANIISVGSVVSIDAASATAKVQIGDLTTPSIPINALRAGGLQFWWMPTVGEQVIVAAPSGDMAQALILGSVFSGNAPSADAGSPMINLGGGQMHVLGDLVVDGDVIASGVSLVHHTHSGIVPGGGNTGEPNQ